MAASFFLWRERGFGGSVFSRKEAQTYSAKAAKVNKAQRNPGMSRRCWVCPDAEVWGVRTDDGLTTMGLTLAFRSREEQEPEAPATWREPLEN